MKTPLLVTALFAATACAVLAYPARQALVAPRPAAQIAAPAAGKPKVEAVFVLDTTGSMSGLIDAAKENIWSIASNLAAAQPAPELKIGLVAYRDRGDAYVTRVVDLSADLDSMYATLMDFRAEGGGDGPESVNQALHDAVHRVSWSQGSDAYKVVFLVGDAPPHMDYADDVKYPDTLKAATARGIVVNTVQAGTDPAAQADWQQIARLNQGAYFQVAMDGQAVAMATPFDEQLAALSHDLDATRLFYGDAPTLAALERKQEATDKLHAASSAASRARRAEFNASPAGAGNLTGGSELVADVDSGRVDLASLDPAKLPEPLRDLGKDEQARIVREAQGKRAALSQRIAALSAERQAYIAGKLEAGRKDASLDARIHGAVKAQAAAKGLVYAAEPKY